MKGIFPEIISSLELAYFPEIPLEFPWKCTFFGEALLFGNRDLVFPLICEMTIVADAIGIGPILINAFDEGQTSV